MIAPAVVKAKAEALAARADLEATLAELKERLSPRHIAQNAWEGVRDRGETIAERSVEIAQSAWEEVRDRGEDLAERGVEIAVRKPGLTAGVVAVAALLLVRKPVARALRGLFAADNGAAPPAEPPSTTYRDALGVAQEEILP